MIKKRLVFTVTNDLSFDQRMIRICSSLSRNGYEVLLIGREKKSSLPLSKEVFQQKRIACFFEKGKFFYLEYNFRLFWVLLFLKFDLICGIDLDTLLPAFLTARLKRRICVYDAHEYFTESPELVHRKWIKGIWSLVGRLTVPYVDGAYTVCQSLAKIMGERYFGSSNSGQSAKAFSVIRNVPFSLPMQKEEFSTASRIILYQGALNDGRGLPELLFAMKQINGAVLWLAGEGDLSTILRKQKEELQLGEKVKFLGYLRPTELSSITRQAYIGLNLLENKGLSYYYSLANKAFDYIQSEKPAIHMDFPEYRLLNETYETALLIPDLKTETIQKAIERLLTEESSYRRLKENTKVAKLVYNWEQEEKVLLSFYNNILTS